MSRLGIFVAGFRWSGSSAVTDWLLGHSAIVCPAAGEILALNYGLTNLLRIAEGKSLHGERLARLALCPDERMWGDIFGRSLLARRPFARPAAGLVDAAFNLATYVLIRDRLRELEAKLTAQLRRDFRADAEYLRCVTRLVEALRQTLGDGSHGEAAIRDRRVRNAASELVAVFYDRWSSADRVAVFDNAISGRNPRYLSLIGEPAFDEKLVIFVRRDPRDQFAELVRFGRGTWAASVRFFVSEYRRRYEEAMRVVDSETSYRMVEFEAFVCDRADTRSLLAANADAALTASATAGRWAESRFRPEESKNNIGVWRKSGLQREMRLIEQKLGEFLAPEASGPFG